MADAEAGSALRINTSGQVVDAVALTAADYGLPIDAQQVADRGPIVSGYTLVTGVPAPGQAQLVAAAQATASTAADNRSTGLSSNTPLPLANPWPVGFWSYDPLTGSRTEASVPDRTDTLHLYFPDRPDRLRTVVTDTVTCAVSLELFLRPSTDAAFPAIPDVALSSAAIPVVGTRRNVDLIMSGLALTRFPCEAQLTVTNKGDGTLVEIHEVKAIY